MQCQEIRLAREIQPDSIVDGEGIRTVIWTQGCAHHCQGCHNQDTWDFEGGFTKDLTTLKNELLKVEDQDGITLTGGDPFFQVDASLEIAKFAKENNLNVWCYTGFTFEELLSLSKTKENIAELLRNIDILVDGRFDITKFSLNVKFRGSTNQRIIDLPKSLSERIPVIIEEPKQQISNREFITFDQHLYI